MNVKNETREPEVTSTLQFTKKRRSKMLWSRSQRPAGNILMFQRIV